MNLFLNLILLHQNEIYIAAEQVCVIGFSELAQYTPNRQFPPKVRKYFVRLGQFHKDAAVYKRVRSEM